MKKTIVLIITLVLSALTLCSCGNKVLTSDSWTNVNDGDVYTFSKDNTGSHDSTKITYEKDDDIVVVTEGKDTITFNLVEDDDSKKLVPENIDTYYVPSNEYDAIATVIREKNIETLMAYEFWQSTLNNTVKMQFAGDGIGYILKIGNTLTMNWEMIDNNTLTTTVSINDKETITTLDIVEKDGNYELVDVDSGVIWTPKN